MGRIIEALLQRAHQGIHDPWQEHHCGKRRNKDREVQRKVAHIGCDERPRISAQEPQLWRQIVAVFAQESNRMRFVATRRALFVFVWRKDALNFWQVDFLGALSISDAAREPASDVSAA